MNKEIFTIDLTEAQRERLIILAEECAEVIQAVSKVLRHGFHAHYDNGISNKVQLEIECGDIRAAMIRLCNANDLNKTFIHESAEYKLTQDEFLHFQTEDEEK